MTKKIVKKVKVPGGRVVLHYKKSKPKTAKCGGCGNILHGVPRLRAVQLRKLAKTEKRPERPYGGVFCCRCVRKMFSEKARKV